MDEKKLDLAILKFLFEQELKRGDSDEVEWSQQKLKELIMSKQ